MVSSPISALEIVLSGISILAYIYLGLAIFLRDPKSWTNKLFISLATVLIAYTIVNPISLHPPQATPESQLFWIRMVIFFASFIGPILFLLVHTFPGRKITLDKKYILLVFAILAACAIASLTPLIFESISYPNGQPVPKPGNGIFFFILDFPVLVITSFILLILKYRRTTGQEKEKNLYFFVGILLTFSIMVVLTITLVVLFKTPAGIFLGPISPLILTAFIAYAIVKHQFLDIKLLVIRSVSFLLAIAFFSAIYATSVILILEKFINFPINAETFIFFLVLLVFGTLLFQPLERFIRNITNKFFFRGRYDKDELISKLTQIMSETLDLGKLTSKVLETLSSEMKLTKAGFLMINDHKITDIYKLGYTEKDLSIPKLESLFHIDMKYDHHFLLEDLEEGDLMKTTFRSSDIAIAIPIRMENSEIAILVLGPKLSGETFYSEDVELLNVFSSEAGIAIQNAKSYAEIKKFSEELEKKVEERTKELKEAQQGELAKAKDIARLKDEFVFLATHELRTPVTAIRGFLSLVSESKKNFPKDIRNDLDAIESASNVLNQLINDLLEVARSESGTMKVETKQVDVVSIIKDVLEQLSALADRRKIKLKMDKAEDVRVIADENKLKEVLTNLVGNAIKYNKDGGEINISILKASPDVIIEIRDTGYGIPKENQDKIFQKFFRAVSKETQEIIGTGLGLFITRMLVEKMGGKIMFTSEEGKGTTFAFSLPQAQK